MTPQQRSKLYEVLEDVAVNAAQDDHDPMIALLGTVNNVLAGLSHSQEFKDVSLQELGQMFRIECSNYY